MANGLTRVQKIEKVALLEERRRRLCALSPLEWVRENLNVEPTEQQAALLNAVAPPGSHTAARSGHGTGKSASLAWLILWALDTLDEVKVPVTAPSASGLRDTIWPEIGKWARALPSSRIRRIEVQSERAVVVGREDLCFAVARTARKENPDALQGFHAKNLLFLVDEAPGVPEEIYLVAEGALSTPGARVVLTGNPTRITGYFHNAFHRDAAHWTLLHFDGRKSPLVSPDYCRSMAERYGEDSDIFKVRVAGDFPSADVAQFIPGDLVDAAMKRVYHQADLVGQPKVLGVDVARFGDDRSVILRRHGQAVTKIQKLNGVDTMTLAAHVAQQAQEWEPDALFVDSVGIGAGVVDRLRQLGYRVIESNGGSAAREKTCGNLRAQMWTDMKEWLKAGSLPNDCELKSDLVGLEYFFDAKGRLMLEKKEDMKKRGLNSPDIADALAMTFTLPVAPKSNPLAEQFNRRQEARTDYQLFGRHVQPQGQRAQTSYQIFGRQ